MPSAAKQDSEIEQAFHAGGRHAVRHYHPRGQASSAPRSTPSLRLSQTLPLWPSSGSGAWFAQDRQASQQGQIIAHGELYDADAAGAHRSGEHHRYPHEGAGQREARKRGAGTSAGNGCYAGGRSQSAARRGRVPPRIEFDKRASLLIPDARRARRWRASALPYSRARRWESSAARAAAKQLWCGLLTRDYDVTGGAVRVDGTRRAGIYLPAQAAPPRSVMVPQAAQPVQRHGAQQFAAGPRKPRTDSSAVEGSGGGPGRRLCTRQARRPGYSRRRKAAKTSPAARSQRLTIARALAASSRISWFWMIPPQRSGLPPPMRRCAARCGRQTGKHDGRADLAQRASTIKNADRHPCAGRRAAARVFGTHEALLRSCEACRGIYRSQKLLEDGVRTPGIANRAARCGARRRKRSTAPRCRRRRA